MVTSTIRIKSSVDTIWKALTDRNIMKEWYFDISDFELKEGAEFNFYESEQKVYHHRCVILEIVPQKKLVHTWTHPSHSKGSSTVTWTLNEEGGVTVVNLQHEGVENFADAGSDFSPKNFKLGWDGILMTLNNYAKGMKKHKFSVEIDATKEEVWSALWDKNNYSKWTSIFSEGSIYEGDLAEGKTVMFINQDGAGMFAEVIFFKPNEFVLFQHKGCVENRKEQPLNEETEQWVGAFESYSLNEINGKTNLLVEIDVVEKSESFFVETFPKALDKVKELATTINSDLKINLIN